MPDDLFDYFTRPRPLAETETPTDDDIDEERQEYERLGVSFDEDDLIEIETEDD